MLFTQWKCFRFWRPKCLSHLKIKLNKNCKVTVSQHTVKVAIHGVPWGHIGGVEIQLHLFSTSALHTGQQWALHPSIHSIVGWWVPPWAGSYGEKVLLLLSVRVAKTIQHSHHTSCTASFLLLKPADYVWTMVLLVPFAIIYTKYQKNLV